MFHLKKLNLNSNRRCLILLVALAAGLIGPLPILASDPLPDGVLATVDGDAITIEHLEAELGRIHAAQMETQRSDYDVERLIDKLINDRLMIHEARLLELDSDPDYLKRAESYRLKLLADQLLNETIPDTFSVSEAELLAYFEEQYRRLRFLMLSVRTFSEADSFRQVITRGGDMQELARQHSLDTYRYRGGDRGLVHWIDIENRLKDLAMTMEVGETSSPFPNRDAYSIVKLAEESPADTAELGLYRRQIRTFLIYDKRMAALDRFYDLLEAKYGSRVDSVLLAEVTNGPGSPEDALDDPALVVAVVGGKEIAWGDLKRMLMHSGSWGKSDVIQSMKPEALTELIRKELLQQEIETEQTIPSPRVAEKVATYQDSLLLMTYLSQIVAPQISIEDAEIDSIYQANRQTYRDPSDVKLSQITVTTAEQAEELKQRLSEGADFQYLAKTYSRDDYAVLGGDLGWVHSGSYPDVMREAFDNLEPGEITGPYRGEDGFLLFRLNDRKEGAIQEFSRVAGRLRQLLFQHKFNLMLDKVLSSLRENSDISVNQEAIDILVIGSMKDE